jgi:hypothetical protein
VADAGELYDAASHSASPASLSSSASASYSAPSKRLWPSGNGEWLAVEVEVEVAGSGEWSGGGAGPGRDLHSSKFRLNVSIFCGIRWLHDFFPQSIRQLRLS